MVNKEQILEEVSNPNYRPVRIRELSRNLHITDEEYRQFRSLIKEMVRDGALVRLRGGKIASASSVGGGVGVFYARRNGGGLVIPEDEGVALHAGDGLPHYLLHGDRILYRITGKKESKRYVGFKVIKVIYRPGITLVGVLRRIRKRVTFNPDDNRYPSNIPIDLDRSVEAKHGQKVVAHIDASEDPMPELVCRITEVLGYPGEPHLDIEALIRSYGLTNEFPREVENEVQNIPNRVPVTEIKQREDFRDTVCVTIDPDTAKDFDDAVSIKKLKGGRYELGVHIADVAHYVQSASPVDTEALLRGTSVYPVDRVIPMLPEKLSNQLCSLRPDVNRLTVSCIMQIDKKGNVVKCRLTNSVIRSTARLTYNQVQEYFDGADKSIKKREVRKTLDDLLKLSKLIRQRRYDGGSLDFDLPEPLVTLDEAGRVIDITTYPRYDSHRLIEECMLAANVAVARFALSNGLPILYRVHDKPNEEKIENFAETLKEFGYRFSFKGEITPKKLQRVMDAVEGKPEQRLINELMLRSMKKALYQPERIGHFALGFPIYTHFTSPIRRYPDLLTHRVIKKFLAGKFKKSDLDEYKAKLDKIGEICSEREKLAEEVERESIKIKAIQFISDRIGGLFNGVISGMIKSGLFVQLEGLFVEGFIRYSELTDDYYEYDEQKHWAIGRRHGRKYRLGDEIQVVINRVDIENYRVDLIVAESQRKKTGKRKRKR